MRDFIRGAVSLSMAVAVGGFATQATAGMTSSMSPGSLTLRLNGQIAWYAAIEGSSLDSPGNGTKTNTINFNGYLRLYPGFDAVAANGLHYGAAAEIRTNIGASATAETLFEHQAYCYLGLPKYGQISVGQENGPSAIFTTGEFDGFSSNGAWNGDAPILIPAGLYRSIPSRMSWVSKQTRSSISRRLSTVFRSVSASSPTTRQRTWGR
jgi:hypothetical protein